MKYFYAGHWFANIAFVIKINLQTSHGLHNVGDCNMSGFS